jgi:hypothetical protein
LISSLGSGRTKDSNRINKMKLKASEVKVHLKSSAPEVM